jgi:hypothetical protein
MVQHDLDARRRLGTPVVSDTPVEHENLSPPREQQVLEPAGSDGFRECRNSDTRNIIEHSLRCCAEPPRRQEF